MMEIKIHDVEPCEPFEYFCRDCLQLRMSYGKLALCGNCGGHQLVFGKLGELDKQKLIDEVLGGADD